MNDKRTGHFEFVRTLECRASVLLDLPWGGVRSCRCSQRFIAGGILFQRSDLAQASDGPSTAASNISYALWALVGSPTNSCCPVSKVAAAESHPDPMWSTQKFGSIDSIPLGTDRIRPVRYWLTQRSNIVRSTKDWSLYRIVLKVATFRPNQSI